MIDDVEYVPRCSDTPSGVSLGETLRAWRIRSGETLDEVADNVGISKTYLCELETSKATEPSLRLAAKLSRYYGMPLDALAKTF